MTGEITQALVHIPVDSVHLEGELILPPGALGVVAFARGSGSSRHSPRNTFVASVLHAAGLGTLLFDLLTQEEDADYARRFEITLLTSRLIAATHWLRRQPQTNASGVGYFGASTDAGWRCGQRRRWAQPSRWWRAGVARIWQALPWRRCRHLRC